MEDNLLPSETSVYTYSSPLFILLDDVVHTNDELDSRQRLLAVLREERKRIATFTTRTRIFWGSSFLFVMFLACLMIMVCSARSK